MPITLNGSGTITGVSVGGLPDGIVDTDMIAAAAVTGVKKGAGSILQVVQTVKSDVFSSTSQTYVDITGLTVDITPVKTNSNILKNPEINLEVGQEYLTYLLDLEQVSRNLIFLAAAYNGGPGNLQKWKNETNYMEDSLFFMESIPSRETRWFIEKILTKYWIYQNKNNKELRSLKMLANGNDPLY